jgi:hypothetical protein
MKLRSLFLTMLILFAMVLGAVAAQDMPMNDCLNLGADDCAIVNGAYANLTTLTNFTLELDVAFEAAGLPDETMSSLTFDMSGAINVTEGMGMMLPVNMGGGFDIEATQNGEPALPPMSIEFALVDDFAYFTDPFSGFWSGIDLVALLSSEEFGSMLDSAMAGDTSALGVDTPDMATILPLLAVLDLPGFLNYERDGDDFVFTIDFAALQALNDPENAGLLAGIDAALTEADPSMAGMAAALPMMISDGQIEVVQSVNTDLNIVDNIAVTAYLELAMGVEPITVDLAVNLALTNIDEAPAAEAPAEFEDMTSQLAPPADQ